jgi:hypothetical protein
MLPILQLNAAIQCGRRRDDKDRVARRRMILNFLQSAEGAMLASIPVVPGIRLDVPDPAMVVAVVVVV